MTIPFPNTTHWYSIYWICLHLHPLLPSWVEQLSSPLSSDCFPYCSFSSFLLFLLSVCFSTSAPFSFNFFYRFCLLLPCFSLLSVISCRFPCLPLLYCLICLCESLHFDVVLSFTKISPYLLFNFHSLVHCSSLLISILFWLLKSVIQHTCVHFVSRPCTWLFTTE